MGGKWNNLIGRNFGRLTVLNKAESYISPSGRKERKWECVCNCGNPKLVYATTSSLKQGVTTSCGCYQKEQIAKSNLATKKKYNDYEIQEDYVIMYTSKGEPFLVDLEDFWRVKDICWHKNNNGYFLSYQGSKTTYLHRLIMDCPDDMDVDHKYGSDTKYDNRKYNLRICTKSENARNKELEPQSYSHCVGVVRDKKTNKWIAQIGVNGKTIILGRYVDLDDAIQARKDGERQYFGEWSYDNSRS